MNELLVVTECTEENTMNTMRITKFSVHSVFTSVHSVTILSKPITAIKTNNFIAEAMATTRVLSILMAEILSTGKRPVLKLKLTKPKRQPISANPDLYRYFPKNHDELI